MIRHTALAVLLAASPLFAQAQTSLKPLQGTWILTTPDGKPLAESGDLTIVITGDKYAQAVAGAVNERGTIKLDATKKPTWIDLTITEGTDAGKLQVGLIEVTAGVMKGALAVAGSTTRPTSIAAAPDVILFIAKKKPA